MRYIRALFNLLLLLSFSTFCYATPAFVPFDSIYISMGIGGVNGNFNMSQQPDIFVVKNFHIITPGTTNVYDNAVLGSVSFGYEKNIKRFVIGVKGVAEIENMRATKNFQFQVSNGIKSFVNASARLSSDYAILFIPGFAVSKQTLIYGLVGPRWGYFQTGTSEQFELIGANVNEVITGAHHAYRLGLTFGFGIETYLGRQVTAGIEYAYTKYGNLAAPSLLSGPILFNGVQAGTVSKYTYINGQTNALLLNISAHFAG